MSDASVKGPAAEEALRNYFLNIGYFVVRGCKFRYCEKDVTDIDLWLYDKGSAFRRERINVDIKNKKTPQAIERIFWAKGLQAVLGLDACIVATTDSRPEVRAFGLEHGVSVLDGTFFGRLVRSGKSQQQRISEEDFLSEIESSSLGKLGGDWKGRYEQSKSRLLDSLSFDGANAWLNDIQYFLQQAVQSPNVASAEWRLVYTSIAYFLISVDFILREYVAADHEQRKQLLEDGFRYGSSGRSYTQKVGDLASALVTEYVDRPGIKDEVRRALMEQAKSVRSDLLAEYLSKGMVPSLLFDQAKEFEAGAFQSIIQPPSSMSASAKGLIGVISDFFSIDRKKTLA